MSIGRVPGTTGIQPSIVDAKGDIIAATAADSVSRLAVGTNNQVLTADSSQATGLKYANGSAATLTTTGDLLYASAANTPARLGIGSTDQVLKVSGGVPTWAYPTTIGCRVGATNVAQSIPNATGTAVNWTAEWFDSNGFHDNSTNTSRFTIPTGLGGKYLCIASIWCDFTDSTRRDITWGINGSEQASAFTTQVFASKGTVNNSTILNVIAGDYIQLFFYQASGGARDINQLYSSASIQYLGV